MDLAVCIYCAYHVNMASSFDPAKNAASLRKHGISLAEGDGVLNDPLTLTLEDLSSQGEQRFISIGMNVFGKLRVVALCVPWRRRSHHLSASGGTEGSQDL